jgi:hypothetical protein
MEMIDPDAKLEEANEDGGGGAGRGKDMQVSYFIIMKQ